MVFLNNLHFNSNALDSKVNDIAIKINDTIKCCVIFNATEHLN